MTTDSLLGTWKLKEWSRIAADGTVTHPFTAEATGRLIYAANGLMSAFLMTPDWSVAAERAGGRGVTAYSARWELLGDIVHHAVDFASDPRMLGETLRRRVVPTVSQDDPEVQAMFAALDAEEAWDGELDLLRSDGSRVRVNLRTTAVRDAAGRVLAIAGIITELPDTDGAPG